MTKSRIAPAALVLMLSGPAPAASIASPRPGIEQMIENQRRELRDAMRIDCPQARDEEEIVVCGRQQENDRHRLPIPVARAAGVADQAGGEQRAALAADTSRCTAVGPNQQCTRGLDMMAIGAFAFRVARRLIEGRE
jgi:hypothetical protein